MALRHSYPRAATFAAILNLFSNHEKSWIRERVWGPMQTLITLFALVEPGRPTSYQSACVTVNTWAGNLFKWLREPHPSGFARARERVTEPECQRLLDTARSMAQHHLRRSCKRISGCLPVVFDGSILHMRHSQEHVQTYGIPKDKFGIELCHYPQALLVSAWDLARRIPLAWTLASHASSERSMLLELLSQIPINALLILDRGYPSDVVFGKIIDSKRHFVARMVASKGAAWQEVNDFLASGRRDAIVPMEVGEGKSRRTVHVRMILRTFDPGRPKKHQKRKTMVIVTSLLDTSLTAREICRLYGERWGIETLYREIKAVAIIEHWHGESVKFVRQELILLLVWFCFAAIFAASANRTTISPVHGAERWRANTRRVFEAIVAVMISLIAMRSLSSDIVAELTRRADSALRAMCVWVLKCRLGRSAPRIPLHPYARTL